jgi:cell division protease FtsH
MPRGVAAAQVLALLAMFGLIIWSIQQVDESRVPYSEFKSLIDEGNVEEVIFDGDVVRARLPAEAGAKDDKGRVVETVLVAGDESLVPTLDEKGIEYSASARSGCAEGGVGLLLPMLMLAGLWVFFLRNRGGAGGVAATFGRSGAKFAPEKGTGVTFADVAGIDEAKEELQEVVQFLQTPERFTALGGRIPKGVLLIGPPGTGKTLLARAVAGEAGVPFLSISGSDFVEMFVGVGAARVRDLFSKAQEHAPCIIFIDEIDAIGKARGVGGPVGGNDEREQTLNQLLVEMDGFDAKSGVIIMAATNRPETLDRALLRAGRFDRQVLVDRPDLRGRIEVLNVHSREVKLAGDVELERLARMTPGMAGADLANILNEGALLAARRGKSAVEMADLRDAVERVIAGLERKNRGLSPKDKRLIAYHEAGHAICAAASPGADPVQKISIIPRGVAALGYTLQIPDEDRYLLSRNELQARLVALFGGRAAEEEIFVDFTTGASNDLEQATDIARSMITRYGMNEALGAVSLHQERSNPFGMGAGAAGGSVSQATAELIDREVRALLSAAHNRSRAIVRTNLSLLHEMAAHLQEQEVLEGEVMEDFLDQVVAPPEAALG